MVRGVSQEDADTLLEAIYCARKVEEQENLPPHGGFVLMYLARQPDGAAALPTVRQECCFDEPGVSRITGSLEREKLVERSKLSDDKRISVIRLTDAGWSVIGRMIKAAHDGRVKRR